ncbi:Aste57867_10686 [Aphanomyces stellatus]|uniref:Aste57867_10686 protein n=1 Tax=Aphanomyces stellatus TaxID=120398 RepID=A0A485KR07_9STRA|nr:hypothetical protein As57867_010646 [Aphanomyces stellatus]VFT87558.1 Aste57867_10686 [Aphanomyces stellatus]
MASSLALAATAIVAPAAAALIYVFGPGHEDAPERAVVPPQPEEARLQATFKHETGSLMRPHNVRLYTQYYYPKTATPKAVIVYLHGINAHSGRFAVAFDDLLQRDYIVGSFDFRGYGRSSGTHGYIANFADFADDALAFLEATRAKFPSQKLFLVGVSMGALVQLYTLLKARDGLVDGAVIHAPPVFLAPGMKPPRPIEMIGRLLVHVVPKLPVIKPHSSKSNSDSVAEHMLAWRLSDPIFYAGRLRVGTGFQLLEATEGIQAQYHNITTPFCLIHGENDRVCAVEGSDRFFEAAMSTDKEYIKYPNGEHNLLDEPEEFRKPYLDDIAKWIDARV